MNNIQWCDAFTFGIGLCIGMTYLGIDRYLKEKDKSDLYTSIVYTILGFIFYLLYQYFKK